MSTATLILVEVVVAVSAVPTNYVMLVIFLNQPSENRNCNDSYETSDYYELRIRVHTACKVKKQIHNNIKLTNYLFRSKAAAQMAFIRSLRDWGARTSMEELRERRAITKSLVIFKWRVTSTYSSVSSIF